jgi:hypothetical protein
MHSNGDEAKKKAFVEMLQAQVGQLGERLYDWMTAEPRTLREMEDQVTGMMRQVGQGRLEAACQL